MLVDLWLLDAELGAAAAKQPWITGQRQADDSYISPTGDRRLLETLRHIASTDVDLARLAVSVPWFVDGTTYHEYFVLRGLGAVATKDKELARLIASFPWFADGSFDGPDASAALGDLDRIASTDIELAWKAVLWLAEGVLRREVNPLGYLNDLALKDIELARRISGLSWFADGITEEESAAVFLLNDLAASDIELAREISGHSWFEQRVTLGSYVLGSLIRLASRETDDLSKLTGQPWFADGLDDEEAALVVTLGWAVASSPELYADLLRTHYTRYRAASLPMAGDVNIWVFQNIPFPPDEDLLTVIEDTARISEQLLEVPFPTNDIILLVVEDVDRRYGFYAAKHLSSFMVLTRRPGGLGSVRHETAHYYFSRGPRWLGEGGAEFIQTYVNDRTGVQALADRRVEQSARLSRYLDERGFENIRHYDYHWSRLKRRASFETGHYSLGENFLLEILETVGEEAMAKALGDIYLAYSDPDSAGFGELDDEEVVYRTFLKHVPVDLRDEFQSLYQQLHGGQFAFPNTDFSDDHGDEPAAATTIEAGVMAVGTLNYMWDFDYFRFQAEEGQKYRLSVSHETLRPTSIGLYAADGLTEENRRWKSRDLTPTGPEIIWTAPSSGEYFFAVQNFGGKTGTYKTTVTPIDSSTSDDHGNIEATATIISFDEVVQGEIEVDTDIDYFGIPVAEGQEYRVEIEMGTLEDFRFRISMPDGRYYTLGDAIEFYSVGPPPGFTGRARSSGITYFAVDAPYGITGTYNLTVVPIDNG